MSDTPLNDIRIGEITSKWAEGNNLYTSYHKMLESTNELAKREAFEENLLEQNLCLYLTDNQTQGRGRGGNTWTQARSGSALISSWSFLIGAKPQPITSCLVGLAVYRACSTTWPFLPWNLKAPNDIYVGNKKVAGLLIENVIQDDETRLIIGLGLNVIATPEDVPTATSLVQSLPASIPLLGQDWMSFLDRLLFEITGAVSQCEEPLSTTDQYSLLMALNLHPLLKEKYIKVEADGSLVTTTKKIPWSTL
jgi:BirA family biotin operon repressor/biotin-[acetyl-CoA-carboxylase] ligase